MYLGVGTCVLGVILIKYYFEMNYYFHLILFTMGELWAMTVLLFLGVFWCCVVWGIFLFVFWITTNRAQIIVFERFGSPEKGL